jgi:hypothetical protein
LKHEGTKTRSFLKTRRHEGAKTRSFFETRRHEGAKTRSFFETRRHKGAKTRSFFYKTKMLKIEKYFQPFERIELIEPFEQPLNH